MVVVIDLNVVVPWICRPAHVWLKTLRTMGDDESLATRLAPVLKPFVANVGLDALVTYNASAGVDQKMMIEHRGLMSAIHGVPRV